MMPSFTADYYGPKHVGANYGLLFSAWGLCGFIVPGYFAGILDGARLAGDLAGGYREVYWKLALLAAVGAAVTAVLRPRLEIAKTALRALPLLLLMLPGPAAGWFPGDCPHPPPCVRSDGLKQLPTPYRSIAAAPPAPRCAGGRVGERAVPGRCAGLRW